LCHGGSKREQAGWQAGDPDYGHIDCIFGETAARDVYPLILEQLEDTAD